MTPIDHTLDARLRALDPSPAGSRRGAADADWARAARDRLGGGGSAPPRRRGRLRGALAAGAVMIAALVLVAALLIASRGGGRPDAAAARTITLTAVPFGSPPRAAVTPASLSATVDLIGERARGLGIDGLAVAVRGADGIALTVPRGATDAMTDALIAPGRLSVLPYDRVGPQFPTLADATGYARRKGLAPSTMIVREPLLTTAGIPTGPATYEILRATAAVRPDDVTSATAVAVARGDRTGGTDAAVSVTLTPRGVRAFGGLTRLVAEAGRLRGRPQAVAVVLDGRLLANPIIDYTQYPDGISGQSGVQIPVSSPAQAREVAAELDAGPLPLRLVR